MVDPDVPVPPPVSAHTDPEGEAPWAMQFVVDVPRADPPTHVEVCAAAAVATVSLLADPRAAEGGEWAPMVQRWWSGRIRKHVRRARGARFEAVSALPGVLVERGGARVRALVPGPTDAIDPLVARLQLSGLDLDHEPSTSARPDATGPVLEIFVSAEPVLATGKAAAAAGHAAQLAWARFDPADRVAWESAGFPLTVTESSPQRWVELLASEPVVVVHDAGFTEVDPGTVTSAAIWT